MVRKLAHIGNGRRWSRREAVRLAASASAATLLAACGGGSTPTVTVTSVSAPVNTPAMLPSPSPVGQGTSVTTATVAGVARATAAPQVAVSPMPDAAGKIPGGPGIPDAYQKPPPAFKTVQAAPGRGSKISVFTLSYSPPVPPREQNRYWQELERRLGVGPMEFTFAPQGTYAEKIAAITAGGELPDLTFVHLGLAPDQNRVIQQGAYTDLTPFLTGDALKEFPNLALIDARVWRNAAIRGKLYGVPKPRFNISGSIIFRRDWAEKVGTPSPKNAEEFFALMQDFTRRDPDGNGATDTRGLGTNAQDMFGRTSLGTMFRVPNNWRKNADGSLTAAIETEEFKATVAYQRRLWEAGVYHPDTPTMSQQQARDRFVSGQYGTWQGAIGAIAGGQGVRAKAKEINPAADAVTLVLPGHDGGKGVGYNESGYFGMAAIPAKVGRDRERVKELLRILNYYAAPFGSEEAIFMGSGIEGIHHTLQPDGTRVRTDQGQREIGDLNYIIGGTQALYYPDVPGDAQTLQNSVRELVAVGLDNPVEGFYSPTASARASELSQLQQDRLVAIITGREPFGAFDQLVRDWRSRGGDQIRKEYEQALKEG